MVFWGLSWQAFRAVDREDTCGYLWPCLRPGAGVTLGGLFWCRSWSVRRVTSLFLGGASSDTVYTVWRCTKPVVACQSFLFEELYIPHPRTVKGRNGMCDPMVKRPALGTNKHRSCWRTERGTASDFGIRIQVVQKTRSPKNKRNIITSIDACYDKSIKGYHFSSGNCFLEMTGRLNPKVVEK